MYSVDPITNFRGSLGIKIKAPLVVLADMYLLLPTLYMKHSKFKVKHEIIIFFIKLVRDYQENMIHNSYYVN